MSDYDAVFSLRRNFPEGCALFMENVQRKVPLSFSRRQPLGYYSPGWILELGLLLSQFPEQFGGARLESFNLQLKP